MREGSSCRFGDSESPFPRLGVVAVFVDEVWEPDEAVELLHKFANPAHPVHASARYDTAEKGQTLVPYCLRRSGPMRALTDVTAQIGTRPTPAEREPETEYLWVLSKRPDLSPADLAVVARAAYGSPA